MIANPNESAWDTCAICDGPSDGHATFDEDGAGLCPGCEHDDAILATSPLGGSWGDAERALNRVEDR